MKKYLHGVLGVILIVVGIAFLVLPGPGILLILLGLALLASYSHRARQLLHRARETISRRSREQRLKNRHGGR